ncbi:MAG: hypothetical protein GVY30_11940 [Chloroflexi bacterium]|jgi:hypothetical protein|nr:hypothetical protein [Chloroflexota bacterium]
MPELKLHEKPDEETLKKRRRRARVKQIITIALVAFGICFFVSFLLGVPQSYAGEWWMKPPRYPNAELNDFRDGQVCQMHQPGVYCYEWFYRTEDSIEDVKSYYETYAWRFHDSITFEWRKGRRFTKAWVAEDCIMLTSNLSCYQMIVHPAPGEEDVTELYILERGAVGDFRESEK